MSSLNQTPRGNRVRIAFFGLRNAGKSTLVNAFCGQEVAIVSDTPGTTTDPVSKAMEILPLGPCLITDTAGLDDAGELGEQRVKRSFDVLATTDVAVWVKEREQGASDSEQVWREKFLEACRQRGVKVFEYVRGDDVEALKRKIAEVELEEKVPVLLDGLVASGDRVVCVCPIDASAPKGRLILPQVQVIRECLDLHAVCSVVQPEELADEVARLMAAAAGRILVITDSQAVARVQSVLQAVTADLPASSSRPRLTTFSVLFARQKGDFAEFVRGVRAVRTLKDGDTVLVSERAHGVGIERRAGREHEVEAPTSRQRRHRLRDLDRADVLAVPPVRARLGDHAALIVHCGGCMLTRRELLHRIALAKAAKVPVVNYGIVLSAAAGLTNFDENGIISV